ncbi:glycogen debranching protein GlgX [Oscillibacter sp. 1-3]|uniref:glycogen debranching protein GlgX n=1 Tax=Oscillibacter sp. 1-3 TaxID=1235797 RepID=UPI00033FBD20|nr:glycogen debranching protein GlgX [Oscillibacter sp. 1-3]EOS65890.1 glycogen debranching enzyme GlgX [Oscillibacter sp. 1-3]
MNKENTTAEEKLVLPRTIHLVPMDVISGFEVRPGFYEINGATAIPGGVNFTVHSHNATSIELLLFHRGETEPFAALPFPRRYRIGNVYSMIVFKLNIEEFEYAYRVDGPYEPEKGLIFDKSRYLLDPYAKAVTGQSQWGKSSPHGQHYRARVVKDDFDWKDARPPLIPMEDLIIYELHVRGFTKDPSSGVQYPGTFAGLLEKLPYLLELGVNAVELMPIFEFDEMQDYRVWEGQELCNYWGYNTVSFFAPNTSYAAGTEYNREGNELKNLIKTFQQHGIEVYLDVVFNHTAEGNEQGPFFSFKGLDNNIYYLLTPEGKYYNFSGCGNTVNCNHPIVRQMILDCLRYWVTTYHVDGFRFDLASILSRNEDGAPMGDPPLLQALAFDPILGDVKLIAEAWDAGGLYQVGSFPAWNRWAEWNGRYRDDLRRYLKGDEGCAQAAALRLAGSRDIYGGAGRKDASINFLTCHDGFTLYDLYAYNEKHNEKNGWGGTDGANDNNSWNCGAEGETEDPAVNALRRRMIRSAFALLMCSRGIPMFLAGDEFCNTQFGNNNAYCQDNITSWLDWSRLEKNRGMFRFFQYMIRFRKKHRVLRTSLSNGACGFPDVSFHGVEPWCSGFFESHERYVGVMFAGAERSTGPQVVYVASNAWWEELEVTLPRLPASMYWELAADTWEEEQPPRRPAEERFTIRPRSVMVFVAR